MDTENREPKTLIEISVRMDTEVRKGLPQTKARHHEQHS